MIALKETELIEKRKPREKHFLREDGTIVAKVYSNDVHYLKDGVYEEIDNTLIQDGDCYTNKSNDFHVFYKNQGQKSLIKIARDKNFVDMRLKEVNNEVSMKKKNVKKLDEVAYDNVFEGVDIEYQTLPTKVKETIVLQDNSKDKFTFVVNTNLNLKLKDNTILAMEDEKEIFMIEKPFMKDANGKINNNLNYELKEVDGEYEIDLILDKDWLSSPNTVYPVYVDPTITNMSQRSSLSDTYIYPGDSSHDRNSEPGLMAGVVRNNGTDVTCRTLIKFDLPEIGTGSEVIGAYLDLTAYPYDDLDYYPRNKLVNMYRVTQDWNEETATWDTMHDKYDSSRVESIYYGSRSYKDLVADGVFGIIPVHGLCDINLTDLVKKWYRDVPNYGLLLKSAKEEYDGDDVPAFCSKNYVASGDSYNPMPVFQVVYRNLNGLESYMDYQTQSFIDGATYVNTFTGNMTGVFSLGHTIGGKLPATVNAIYNTNDMVLNHDTVFVRGCRLNLDQVIETVTISGNEMLAYHDEDGTIHYFYKEEEESSNTYFDEDGLDLVLEKTDTICTMNDKTGGKMLFTKIGNSYYLTKIVDVQGNEINIQRNESNLITKITDANNAEINIVYEYNQIQVASPDTTTTLNIMNGNLSSIVTRNGTTTFSYNGNNLIQSITDVSGLKITYEYYNQKPYRIKKVTQYGLNNTLGNYFEISYGFNTSKITDSEGKTQTLVFNNGGNLLSIHSLGENDDLTTAYAITRNYGDDSGNKNKLLSDAIPTRYIKNYLKNTSFETDEDYFTNTLGITKVFTEEEAYSGKRSLKVTTTSDAAEHYLKLSPNDLVKGKSYTFSGFFKCDSSFDVKLSYFHNEDCIESVMTVEKNSEFKREDITLYYLEDATSPLEITIKISSDTTLYIDNIQLEEGEVANEYNVIDNSDFSSGLSDWQLKTWAFDGTEAQNTSDVFQVVSIDDKGNTALKVNMNPLHGSRFIKEFPIKGKKGDLYNLSFWFKNEGIPADGNIIGNSVMIDFKPVNSDLPHCILPSEDLHVDENIWQYFTFRYGADEDYESIRLVFNQGREANNFYITNLTFYKDLANNYYEYDSNGNVTSIKSSTKEEANAFRYDSNNQLISSTTPMGANLKFEYDNVKTDQVVSSISSMGIRNQVKYDSFGNPIRTIISKKGVPEVVSGQYRIRSKGSEKYVKARNRNIVVEEDACSNTIWKVEKTNDKYTIAHDLLSNYKINCVGETVSLHPIFYTEFELEQNQNGSYHIQVEWKKYLKVVDGALKVVEEANPNDPSFEFYFETIDSEFIETSATYTEDGRFVTSVTDSNFHTKTFVTNPVTGLLTSETDAKGNVTNYAYNDKKQITSVSQGDMSIQYSYNDKNLLSKIKQGNREYNFTYNDFLNKETVKIGDNITLSTSKYNPRNGNLSQITYGNGAVTRYYYDEFNRLSMLDNLIGTYEYRYDNNGNLAKILKVSYLDTYDTTGGGNRLPLYESVTKYRYDIGKRIVEYQKDKFKINYQYDANDNVVQKDYHFGPHYTSYDYSSINTFDKDNMLTKMILGDTVVDYQYDGLGRLNNRNINNNYQSTYQYVSNGKRTSNLVKSLTNGNDTYSYQYNELGNIIKIYHNDNLLNQYDYDAHNQLIEDIDYNRNEKTSYQYDNYGNMLTKNITDLATNTITKTDTYEYGNTEWCDQLTKFNDTNIEYDQIGNPTVIGKSNLLWAGRTLMKHETHGIEPGVEKDIYYKYNQDGIRTYKRVERNIVQGDCTLHYVYYELEGNRIIYENRDDEQIITYFYDLTGIVGIQYNGSRYYYVKNLQGDIVGILNSNHNRVATYEYDSWGKILSIKDSEENDIVDENHIGLINPFRYRSYYYDEETGWYYLNSRYYNPEWGRFINTDRMIGANQDILSQNMYLYCSNNPVINIDSDGFTFVDIVSSLVISKLFVIAGSNTYLTLKGYNISNDMFNKSMYNPAGDLAESTKKEIVKKTKKSTELRDVIKLCVHNSNGNTNSCSGNLEYKYGDLHYSMQHVNYDISVKKVDDYTWQTKVKLYDIYDFNEFRKGFSFSALANNLGLAMQNTGLLKPYYWEVEYTIIYMDTDDM